MKRTVKVVLAALTVGVISILPALAADDLVANPETIFAKGMADFIFLHWVIVLVVLLAIVIPFWKILPRAGIPAPVALVSLIPFSGL